MKRYNFETSAQQNNLFVRGSLENLFWLFYSRNLLSIKKLFGLGKPKSSPRIGGRFREAERRFGGGQQVRSPQVGSKQKKNRWRSKNR